MVLSSHNRCQNVSLQQARISVIYNWRVKPKLGINMSITRMGYCSLPTAMGILKPIFVLLRILRYLAFTSISKQKPRCIVCMVASGWYWGLMMPLLWRHNDPDGVSNHQPHDCLLNRLFGHRSKKTSKLRVTGLCAGNSPETGEFPAQMASNAENVSIWWRHHAWRRQEAWSLLVFVLAPVQHKAIK